MFLGQFVSRVAAGSVTSPACLTLRIAHTGQVTGQIHVEYKMRATCDRSFASILSSSCTKLCRSNFGVLIMSYEKLIHLCECLAVVLLT